MDFRSKIILNSGFVRGRRSKKSIEARNKMIEEMQKTITQPTTQPTKKDVKNINDETAKIVDEIKITFGN